MLYRKRISVPTLDCFTSALEPSADSSIRASSGLLPSRREHGDHGFNRRTALTLFSYGGFLGLRLCKGAFRHLESRCAEAAHGDLTPSGLYHLTLGSFDAVSLKGIKDRALLCERHVSDSLRLFITPLDGLAPTANCSGS